jgi:hypothetical protein
VRNFAQPTASSKQKLSKDPSAKIIVSLSQSKGMNNADLIHPSGEGSHTKLVSNRTKSAMEEKVSS